MMTTTQFDSLSIRTGSYGFFFITRGHINDTYQPTWYGTNDSTSFFEEVLQLDPDDTCGLFEQWACARSKSKFSSILRLLISTHFLDIVERDSLQNVRAQVVQSIQIGLRMFHDVFSYWFQ
jgi:hypothetical protein